MIITCKECETRFNLDESLLKKTGTKVRCSKCKNIFLAYPPVLPKESDNLEDKKPEMPEDEFSPEKLDFENEEPEIEKQFGDQPEMQDAGSGFEEDALSDIGKMLEVEEEPEAAIESDTDAQDLEMEGLDLSDLDKMLEVEKESETDAPNLELEEIDLSELDKMLEMDEEPEAASESDTDAQDLEMEGLDLSDLDKMLEGEEEPEADTRNFELEEIDLSELDDMLKMDEEPEEASESEVDTEEELELEFNIEEEPEQKQETIETADSEDKLEFELSEIEEINQEKDENKFDESAEAEDIELKFEIDSSNQEYLEEDEDTDEVKTEQLVEEKEEAFSEASIMDNLSNESETSSVEPESAIEETEIEETQPEKDTIAVKEKEESDTAYDASTESVEKKKINTFVLVLIILALLVGIAFGTLFMLNHMGINIPYMSELLKPKVQDDIGNLKISTLYVTSKFVEAPKTGKLFVITGKAKNSYSEPRSFIKIAGKLYTKGKKLAKTETVFCGNVLSDLELSNLDIETIKKRLLNRFGDKRTNVKVEPDKLLPFMIVFNELPDNLEEFTIEVLRSSPATG